MSKKLTYERLHEVLHYDPITGDWIRKLPIPGFKIGSIAGNIDKSKNNGYRRIMVDGTLYNSSRLVFLYMLGYFPEYQVDHKNRIRDDDRWCNLRHITQQCNLKNKTIYENNKSGITGVSQTPYNTWVANINISRKRKYLGAFDEFVDAVKARWNAEKKYNWSNCCTTSSSYEYLKERNLI